MLKRSKNSVLEMFSAINHLYVNLQSDADKELGIEVVGHSLTIQDIPLRTMLLFQVDNNGGVVIQKYAYTENEDESLLEKERFSMRNMPGIEDYIIAAFEL